MSNMYLLLYTYFVFRNFKISFPKTKIIGNFKILFYLHTLFASHKAFSFIVNVNKGKHRAKHDMTAACRQRKVEQVYAFQICESLGILAPFRPKCLCPFNNQLM